MTDRDAQEAHHARYMRVNAPAYLSGLTTAQRKENAAHDATVDMARDAMASLSFPALCDEVLAHIAARPDIDPERLEQMGNQLGRLADAADLQIRREAT